MEDSKPQRSTHEGKAPRFGGHDDDLGADRTGWQMIAAAFGLLALSVACFAIWGINGHYPETFGAGIALALVVLVLAALPDRPDSPG